MAKPTKKSSTVNLEEKIWEKINDFAEANGINRNKAIEWIVLQHEAYILNQEQIIQKYEQPVETPVVENKSDQINKFDQITTTIDLMSVAGDAFSMMED